MEDKLIRGLARGGNVRVLMVSNKNLIQEAKDIHDTYPTVSAALGRTISATLMMAHLLKEDDEKLIVEIRGEGPLSHILVNADNKGFVRATVSDPHILEIKDNGKLDVSKIIGKGTLKVTRKLKETTVYTSLVDLQSSEIGDDFAYYFAQSEQIPSVVSVGVLVGDDFNIIASGGLIVQVLPSATEEDIVAMEKLVSTLKPMTSLLQEKDIYEIFNDLFEDGVILETQDIQYYCGCNRAQMLQVLTSLSRDDLKDLIKKDKGATLVCHYCHKEYHFDEEELNDILNGVNN